MSNTHHEKEHSMNDFDAKGLEAARRYAYWHTADRTWADSILNAYFNPDDTNKQLDEEEQE
jgi:hypothetical protein